MILSRCSFVDFITSYATDPLIFAKRSINCTKIPRRIAALSLQTYSLVCMSAKSGCVNDSYPGFIHQVHRSFLTTYADRALFCGCGIFLRVRTSYTMICKAPLVGQKKRMGTPGPTFRLKMINLP